MARHVEHKCGDFLCHDANIYKIEVITKLFSLRLVEYVDEIIKNKLLWQTPESLKGTKTEKNLANAFCG